MGTEMMCLVWAVALCVAQMVVGALGATQAVGLGTLAGNREGMKEIGGWTGRALRAHRNMLESLVLFAALVLVAKVAGKTDAQTALGAQMFLWARLAYAVIYVAGLPWIRTGAWVVSIVGLVMIFVRLI